MGNQHSQKGRKTQNLQVQSKYLYQSQQLMTSSRGLQDPLHKFLSKKTQKYQVKFLSQIKTYTQYTDQNKQNRESISITQEQLLKRVRQKTLHLPSIKSNMQVFDIIDQQLQRMQKQNIIYGQIRNSVDKKQIFKKLKINLSNFIKTSQQNIEQYYSFQQCIGEGGFGKVYRAFDKKTKQERAIKFLKQKIKGKQRQQASLLAQFQLLSQLDHPNIVKLYQIYNYKSCYYVVMQMCKGGSLIDFIKKYKQFSQKFICNVARQLLSALAYLHNQGIVHRDIKLDNIVFLNSPEADPSSATIKIIDFGTAINIHTKKAKIVGTKNYMSPQSFRGILSCKADVWACGIFLCLLFIGKFPFKGDSMIDQQAVVNTKTLLFSDRQWKNVSIQAKKLIISMFEKNPEKRLSSSDCLRQPWFTKNHEQATNGGVCITNFSQVQKYQKGNNLIALIQNYISFKQISQQQRERLGKIFRQIDTNNDGVIQFKQMVSIYKEHFGIHTEEQVRNILEKIDMNGSGKIDFNQFLIAAYSRKRLFLQDSLIQAFNHFDVDKNGQLQREQLVKLLAGCEMEQIQCLLRQIDVNNDQQISLEEFLVYLKKFE